MRQCNNNVFYLDKTSDIEVPSFFDEQRFVIKKEDIFERPTENNEFVIVG